MKSKSPNSELDGVVPTCEPLPGVVLVPVTPVVGVVFAGVKPGKSGNDGVGTVTGTVGGCLGGGEPNMS